MGNEPGDRTRAALPQPWLTYPHPKIIATAGRSDADIVAAALGEAGFGRDRIEIIAADEIKGLGEDIGASGLRRVLVRFQLGSGSDLGASDGTSREPVSGYALVQIRVREREEHVRAHAILHQDGGHDLQYFGRWTVTSPTTGHDA